MSHVVNFSPLPTDAVASQLGEVDATVVSVRDVADAVEACRGATVAIADFSSERRIEADHVEAMADTCRAVVVPSTGVDSIDLDACRAHGVPVATARGLNADAVAEWAVWATIGGLRHLGEVELGIRDGEWQQFGTRHELAGRRVGIVGIGPIGAGIAERLRGWSVELAYWTRTRRDHAVEEQLGVAWSELDDLFGSCDVVVLAVALTPETTGLVDRRRLDLLGNDGVIVNAARGAVVDEAEVAAALAEGRLHAYATDVLASEPPSADDPMLKAATIVTPHVAGVTAQSVGRILGRTIENVNRVLAGEEPFGLL